MNLILKFFLKIESITNSARVVRMKAHFKKCGKDVFIDPTCNILIWDKFEIGDNSSISSYTTIYAAFGVKIGKRCLISSNCGISSINHIQESSSRFNDEADNGRFSKPVTIGDNVWIGMNACILPGVSIGENSIIGSSSVVTKNVPANEVWVGNPARFVKKLMVDGKFNNINA